MRAEAPAQPNPKTVGLFLDVDGTLLEFAPTPDGVAVPDGLIADLAAAEDRLGGALALLSGRPIAELDRLFQPLRLRASGVHGAEMRRVPGPDGIECQSEALPEALVDSVHALAARYPVRFLERKGASLALHVTPDEAPVAALRCALERLVLAFPASDLDVVEGRHVLEIKPHGLHKGTAIERFMAERPFAGRAPVFISDSPMDRAGFDAALALGGKAYGVGPAMAGLSGRFEDPSAVRAWLKRLTA